MKSKPIISGRKSNLKFQSDNPKAKEHPQKKVRINDKPIQEIKGKKLHEIDNYSLQKEIEKTH